MIELIVNGTPFTDFTEAAVTVSLTTLANDFSFTASAVDGFPPLKQGDEVVVIVDREKAVTGTIDEVNGRDTEGNHLVTYSGRDKTGDLLDSQINVIDDIRPEGSLTVRGLIRIVLDHLELDINILDLVNPAPFNKAEDFISPQVGENAFDFIANYAKKRQVLLSSTEEGDILITQSAPTDSDAAVQRLQGANDNNILTQSWTVNASQLFNRYVHRGQLDPRAVNFAGDSTIESVENQSGESVDSDVRVGRQSVRVEADSYSSAQLLDRAKWSNQLAKAKATRFTCSVKGHQKPGEFGELWEINTLVQVNSDVADISRKMLIDTITFSQGEGQPTITTLECVERNVYTINDRILSQRPAGDQNDAFKSLG